MFAWFKVLTCRIYGLLARRELDKDFQQELDAHLEMLTEDNMRKGLAPEEARRAARLRLGGTMQLQQTHREQWGLPWLETVVQDIRYGLRQLRRNPGFTAVAVLTLALGIGANTAIFALMDAVMLRTLPIRDPEQLVQLVCRYHNRPNPDHSGYGSDSEEPTFSYPLFQQLRKHDNALVTTFAFVPLGFTKETVSVVDGKNASMADGEMVSGEFFSGLGVQPIFGRAISDSDEQPGAPHVAVISYAYWSRRFGRDGSILGKTITVGGQPTAVIGVAPPEFFGVQPGRSVDIWVPLSKYTGLGPWGIKGTSMFGDGDWWWLMIMGRLKSGASQAQAQAELELTFQQAAAATLSKRPKPEDGVHLALVPAAKGLDLLRDQYSEPLHILGIGVLLVLLIACANIATLLLARANARAKEITVRLSLGSARGRLVSQLLSESLLLAMSAGALGLGIAVWGVRILARLLTGDVSLLGLVHINGLVLAFTAASALITTALFGVVPAVATTRGDLVRTLKATPGQEFGTARFVTGKALVVGQIAVSMVLLVGAGLMVRTLYNLEHSDLGFRQQNLLVFKLDGTQTGYSGPQLQRLYNRVLYRVRGLPGVQNATYSGFAPLNGWENDGSFAVDVGPERVQNNDALWNAIGPKFFEALGIPILLGRGIEAKDVGGAPQVAVVNPAFARKFFGKADPVGHRVSQDEKFNPRNSAEIVGVVANARYNRLRGEFPPTVYYPAAQMTEDIGSVYFEIRTAKGPMSLLGEARRVVSDISPGLPLADVKTESQQIAEDLVEEHMFARLASFFGFAALLLTCIGLYGTMAYRVSRRTHEIGIRVALGAQRGHILRMVLRETALLVVIGIGVGLPITLASTRLISSLLFGLKPDDAVTIATATALMILVALLAGYWPARRATKVDPMVALRYE
jgi:predicted permease